MFGPFGFDALGPSFMLNTLYYIIQRLYTPQFVGGVDLVACLFYNCP